MASFKVMFIGNNFENMVFLISSLLINEHGSPDHPRFLEKQDLCHVSLEFQFEGPSEVKST